MDKKHISFIYIFVIICQNFQMTLEKLKIGILYYTKYFQRKKLYNCQVCLDFSLQCFWTEWQSFFTKILNLFFVARVTRIGQIPLGKRSSNLKKIYSSYFLWIVIPDKRDHSTRSKTFLLGTKEVGKKWEYCWKRW